MLDARQLGLYAQTEAERLDVQRQTHQDLEDRRAAARAGADKTVERRIQRDIDELDNEIRKTKFRIDHEKWSKMYQVERDNYEHGGLSLVLYEQDGLGNMVPFFRFSRVHERGYTRQDYDARAAAERQFRAEHPQMRWPFSSFAERDPESHAQHQTYEQRGRHLTPFDGSDELYDYHCSARV